MYALNLEIFHLTLALAKALIFMILETITQT